MTSELGRAEFIISARTDQALRDVSKYFNQTTILAEKLAKMLAEHNNVRVRDVKGAAAVLIAEERKLAAEQAKIAAQRARELKAQTQEILKQNQQEAREREQQTKAIIRQNQQEANERKKITQAIIKANQEQYKDEQKLIKEQERARTQATRTIEANVKRHYAEEERQRKARARAITTEEKLIERERIASLNRQNREEAQIRRRNEQQRREEERRRNQTTGLDRFARGIPGDIATIAGFGAIASGAILVRQALVTLTDATLNQEKAQRSLNAAFGETQLLYKTNAEALSKQFNLVTSSTQEATARLGVLDKQTTLTSQQILALQKGLVQLNQAVGGDLQEAFRSGAGAVLGETEAFEKYGLVLQEGVLKSSNKLTEDERRRFTTMSESEKQMIRYRLIMEHVANVQGTSTQRAKDAQGGFDALTRSVDELAKSLGESLIPQAGLAARELAGLVNVVSTYYNEVNEVNKAIDALDAQRQQRQIAAAAIRSNPFGAAADTILGGGLTTAAVALVSPDEIRAQRNLANAQKYRDLEVANIRAHNRDLEKLETERRNKEEAELKVARERIEAGLKYAHEQEIKRIEEAKKTAEREKRLRIDALQESEKQELRSLENIENARKAAHELEVARIQQEKKDALQAIEEREESELERIRVSKAAAEAAAEEQIRQLNVEKEERTRLNEDTKDNERRRLEEEKEERERAREIEDRDIEDSVRERERILEDSHRRTLTRLEREAESLRDRYDEEIRLIEKKVDKEEERHRKRIRQIDDEADEQIRAIDAEIAKIEEAERAIENARRRRELNQKLSDAQRDLRRATGSQDPVAREAAQSKLIAAIRLGDPTAIKKAQDELTEIVGRGIEAVEEAQRNLSNVQEDLRETDVRETQDSQRDKLEAEKDRIRREQEQERRQEEDRNRRRKDRLDKDKDSEKRRLDDALRGIERRREREEDAHRKAKRELDDLVEYNKRKLEDRRREEDQFYEDSGEAVDERYKNEQRAIEDTYDNEKTGSIPAVRRALEAAKESYENQTRVAQSRYEKEREEIENTYDNEVTGLIPNMRRASREAEIEYQRQADIIRDKYELARQNVEKAYRADDGKSGILDQLDTQKEYADTKLDEILKSFDQHAKGLVAPGGIIQVQWATATDQAKKYFDYIERRSREQSSRRQSGHGFRDPDTGIQIGPDPGVFNQPIPPGGGSGVSTAPPDNSGDSGPPVETVEAHEVDMDPNRFTTTFGYGRQYSGGYPSGPGWAPGNTAAWTGGPSHHKGIDISAGMGAPIGSFTSGTVSAIHHFNGDPDGDPGGTYIVIDGPNGHKYWYMHLDRVHVQNRQTVRRGTLIGTQGWSGLDRPADTHLHFEVRRGDRHPNGPRSLAELQEYGIDPSPYIRGRDLGYRFMNPTMYQDLRTGERGVMAERGPELLLGRNQTQQFDSMGLTAKLRRPNVASLDYEAVGAMSMASSTTNNVVAGDNFTYNGVAPENIMRQWREDQRRNRVLRGRANVTR